MEVNYVYHGISNFEIKRHHYIVLRCNMTLWGSTEFVIYQCHRYLPRAIMYSSLLDYKKTYITCNETPPSKIYSKHEFVDILLNYFSST